MVDAEMVRRAYREFLLREPESEEVIAVHSAGNDSWEELVANITRSTEYKSRCLALAPLPVVSPSTVCRWDRPVHVLEPDHADGNVSLIELVILNMVVASRKPGRIFELGTFDGRTTLNFAANAPSDAQIYTIDLPASAEDKAVLELDDQDHKFVRKPRSGARFVDTPWARRITQLYGDTGNFDFSSYYGCIDFVFIDAAHSAPYVRNDTEIALRMIGDRPGCIAWHDYHDINPGVVDTLREYRRRHPKLGGLVHIKDTSMAFCDFS